MSFILGFYFLERVIVGFENKYVTMIFEELRYELY